uniref:Uncharacterized protein n=1 Tax=Mycena chlorophos TaxID=658473 RepID=A0ABQ0KWE0_MYCCL|nr:predicted protein [Mycena chlorophos]
MQPTAVRLRLQPRRPLLSFRANKDYYKGNRQSALPGHRTGAPGVHVNRRVGYKLLESRVRVFVAPPIQDILESPLKPYVEPRTRPKQKQGVFSDMPDGGMNPAYFLQTARKYHLERAQQQQQNAVVPTA